MSFITLAIIAYAFLAVVNIADKFIIDNLIPSSRAYTFLVGVLGLSVIILAPWFLVWSGFAIFLISMIVGAIFPLALLMLYRSLREGEASKMIVIVGGSTPVFTLIFSVLFLQERFSAYQWWGIILLIIGTMIISWIPTRKSWHKQVLSWFHIASGKSSFGLLLAVGAGFCFSLFFIGSKYLFDSAPFMSEFIWIRIGTFLASLALLIHVKSRHEIFKNMRNLRRSGSTIFLGNQGLAAVGFLIQNYAISLGSVAIVNALQGVQYSILLLIAAFVTIFYPKAVKEDVSASVIVQKIFAIIIISIGLYFVAM